jgi:hypothetical protein
MLRSIKGPDLDDGNIRSWTSNAIARALVPSRAMLSVPVNEGARPPARPGLSVFRVQSDKLTCTNECIKNEEIHTQA